MAGSDSSRGFSFQHGYAVLLAVESLADPSVDQLAVEGADDIVDIALADSAGNMLLAVQAKTRAEPYTWPQSELFDVLARWSSLDESATAEFNFVTNGRLGTTGQEFNTNLTRARAGETADLADQLSVAADSPILGVATRTRIVRIEKSGDSLLVEATLQLLRMLPVAISHGDAIDTARNHVNELYRMVIDRAGLAEASSRIIRREEIAQTLGVSSDQAVGLGWGQGLKSELIAASAKPRDPGPFDLGTPYIHPPSLYHPGGTSLPVAVGLERLLVGTGTTLLHGHSGTGKTTALEELRRRAAAQDQLVIVAHAEAYLPGRIEALVADSIHGLSGARISRAAAIDALMDPATLLVIDGASEIPEADRAGLADDLRYLLASGTLPRLILAGREVSTLRALVPTSIDAHDFAVQPLAEDAQVAILMASQAHGLAEPLDEALARIEHLPKGLTENALLFRMLLYLLAEGGSPDNRPDTYEGIIQLLGRRSNAAGMSIAITAGGIAFARLLANGRRYSNVVEWHLFLEEAARHLVERGVPCDATAVNATLRRSGIVTTLGHSELVVPIHDSFADYMSASVIRSGLESLPESLTPNDELRIEMLLEMGELAPLSAIVRDLPFAVPRLSRYSRKHLPADLPEIIAKAFAVLAPTGYATASIFHSPEFGLAIFPRGETEWIDESAATARAKTNQFLTSRASHPLGALSAMWRGIMRERIRGVERRPQPPQLTSVEMARDALVAFSMRKAEVLDELIETIPLTARADVIAVLGPPHLEAVVHKAELGYQGRPEHPVRYVPSQQPSVAIEKIRSGSPDQRQGTLTTVEVMLLEGAAGSAVRQFTSTVNSLTTWNWI